jgi:hypothetical protein
MIRTAAVKMTSINGIAYKQKLAAGGAGLAIVMPGDRAAFTINKRDGACVPYGKVNTDIFTDKVTGEALELTRGLPYKRLGVVSAVYDDKRFDETPVELETEDDAAAIDIIASAEYKEFIAQYTDKNDKFSYQLMNKELMQFAARSSVVRSMLADKADADVIIRYIVKSKAADLARNKGMSDSMLTAFIDTFDSMDTRSAFKELNSYLRSKMSRSKKS